MNGSKAHAGLIAQRSRGSSEPTTHLTGGQACRGRMMRKRASRRRIASAAFALIAIALATSAVYAFWTAGGSGTGTASAGTAADVIVKQTTSLTPMYPGDSAQTISGNFDNTNP